MSMNVNQMQGGGGNDLGDPRLGQHYARLVGFAYIGVHDRAAYKGTPKDPCGQGLLTFELTDDFVEIDGKTLPRWVTKRVNTFNTSNASIVKIYNALDPAGTYGGDFGALVQATIPCMVNIEQKTDQHKNPIEGTKIGSIGGLPAAGPDGQPIVLPAAANPIMIFDFDSPTLEAWSSLKNWMRNTIKEANNFPGSAVETISQQYDVQQAAAQQQAPAQAPATAPATAAAPAPAPGTPAPGPAAAPPAPPAPPAPAPAPAPVVQAVTYNLNGVEYTRDQLIASGWKDEQIAAQFGATAPAPAGGVAPPPPAQQAAY